MVSGIMMIFFLTISNWPEDCHVLKWLPAVDIYEIAKIQNNLQLDIFCNNSELQIKQWYWRWDASTINQFNNILAVFVSIATDEKFALLFNLIGLDWMTGLSVNHIMKIDTSKKETPHSFKGQQLKNKSLYRFVIYKGFR